MSLNSFTLWKCKIYHINIDIIFFYCQNLYIYNNNNGIKNFLHLIKYEKKFKQQRLLLANLKDFPFSTHRFANMENKNIAITSENCDFFHHYNYIYRLSSYVCIKCHNPSCSEVKKFINNSKDI